MKRTGFIYKDVYDIYNIEKAVRNASKGKANRKQVKYCLENIHEVSYEIQKMLQDKTFKCSEFTIKTIVDNGSKKTREITIPKFYPDQIIHWALIQVLEPILLDYFVTNTCASLKGRGTGKAKKLIENSIHNDKNGTKYYAKLDIKKCYPNIKPKVVIESLEYKIKDNDVIWLVNEILQATNGKGLPIGFYTSQWFANLVLTRLDRYILNSSATKHYVRYMDDMIIFGSNKRKLHKLIEDIQKEVEKLGLTLKYNYQVYNFDKEGLDFVGYRFFRNYTIMRKRNFKKMRRLTLRINAHKKPTIKQSHKFMAYYGWVLQCNNSQWYEKNIRNNNTFKKCKKAIKEK